jgi:hypothetical protein
LGLRDQKPFESLKLFGLKSKTLNGFKTFRVKERILGVKRYQYKKVKQRINVANCPIKIYGSCTGFDPAHERTKQLLTKA